MTYDVRYRTAGSTVWIPWKSATSSTSGNFLGKPGKTFFFKARARDKYGSTSKWLSREKRIVPFDQDALIVKRKGFNYVYENPKSSLYLGTSRFAKQPGAWIEYKFTGKGVFIMGTKGPAVSKAKVYVDGAYEKTIDPHEPTKKYRQVLFSKVYPKVGTHTVKIENVGNRALLSLDAVAVDSAQ